MSVVLKITVALPPEPARRKTEVVCSLPSGGAHKSTRSSLNEPTPARFEQSQEELLDCSIMQLFDELLRLMSTGDHLGAWRVNKRKNDLMSSRSAAHVNRLERQKGLRA